MEAKKVLSKLTLEEKAILLSGKDFWHTQELERLGVPSLMMTDGPHGLRKQCGEGDHLGIGQSVPATCFPTAATTACSFDEGLLEEIGAALGEECRKEDVAVLLGPAMNIKRNPLCGRNFEYFSEEPEALCGQQPGKAPELAEFRGGYAGPPGNLPAGL